MTSEFDTKHVTRTNLSGDYNYLYKRMQEE